MEYRITKQELGNEWMYHALFALEKCMAIHGLPLYVVGARGNKKSRDGGYAVSTLSKNKHHSVTTNRLVVTPLAVSSWMR